MGIDINKAKVVFFPDESGTEHFHDFYVTLAEMATQSHDEKVKYFFLRAVLKRLGTIDKIDLPTDQNALEFEFEIDVDGVSYSRPLKIVKKIGKSVVYEIRIDISDFNWYFRATFFPKYHQGELYYCVVHPFVKVPGYDDPTNTYRDLTHKVYKDCQFNPDKYFESPSEED